jgi:hypothetical protein
MNLLHPPLCLQGASVGPHNRLTATGGVYTAEGRRALGFGLEVGVVCGTS